MADRSYETCLSAVPGFYMSAGVCMNLTFNHSYLSGFSVFSKRPISKGEFLLNYHGQLQNYKTACEREQTEAFKTRPGMLHVFRTYFFKYKGETMW